MNVDVDIGKNLAAVWERIRRAARRAGRAPEAITLVAVSKRKPAALVEAAIEAGQVDFGESYLQEGVEKIKAVGASCRWHFIGHLQSNKARQAAASFDVIESVDRIKIARHLEKHLAAQNKTLPVLLQVNISGEPQKSGVAPAELPALTEAVVQCPHLRLTGLMGMPPRHPDPEHARPYFRHLRRLARELQDKGFGPAGGLELSMGMTADFEVAIEEGATIVRVGTALFGTR